MSNYHIQNLKQTTVRTSVFQTVGNIDSTGGDIRQGMSKRKKIYYLSLTNASQVIRIQLLICALGNLHYQISREKFDPEP